MSSSQARSRRPALPRALLALLLVAVGVAGCSGDDEGTPDDPTEGEAAAPAGCQPPPVELTVRGGDGGVGGARGLQVVDAVARRVAIIPGAMVFDPSALSALESQAGITPLALYSLSVSSGEIDREPLAGVGLVEVEPVADETVATLTLIPTDESGLVEGSVLTDGELGYDTTAELRPLGLTVLRGEDRIAHEVDEVEGQVTVLQLTDELICVDVDLTVRELGQIVAELRGVVQAPVVRASDAFFVT